MRIVMIGAGYVGLVSGICFADFGHEVVCVDLDESRISRLRGGRVPIFEPGLEDLLARNMAAGRIRFTTCLAAAVRGADAVFIAVGTPERRGDGDADLTFVHTAARSVGRAMDPGTVVVTKSTVPVGTNRDVARLVSRERPEGEVVHVASNPEFLREGAAVNDFMCPDRVVIGVETGHAREVLERIYDSVCGRGFPLVATDIESAEMIKYASNAFLATRIAFINEMARLCDTVGADIRNVSRGMGLDKRIGNRFLEPGPGYGGSCFPKDTAALARRIRDAGLPVSIVNTVIRANDDMKLCMHDKVMALLDQDPEGKTVAVLGVTFKPGTDDMREASSLTILPPLLRAGATLRICDPEGFAEGERLFPGADWSEDPYDAVRGADAVVLLTDWDVFRHLDLERVASVMARPRFADLRNVYDMNAARQAGFEAYLPVGRPGYMPGGAPD